MMIQPYDWSLWEEFKREMKTPLPSPTRPVDSAKVLKILRDRLWGVSRQIIASRQAQDAEASWGQPSPARLGVPYRQREVLLDLIDYIQVSGVTLPEPSHPLYLYLVEIVQKHQLTLPTD